MTSLTPAPAGLTAYDFHEGKVRPRPVLALAPTTAGDLLAPYVLDTGQLRRLDPATVLLGMNGDGAPAAADLAAITDIGRLELGRRHALHKVAGLVGNLPPSQSDSPSQHATDVATALNAHPVMRALGRTARDETDNTSSSGGDYSGEPRRYIVIDETERREHLRQVVEGRLADEPSRPPVRALWEGYSDDEQRQTIADARDAATGLAALQAYTAGTASGHQALLGAVYAIIEQA